MVDEDRKFVEDMEKLSRQIKAWSVLIVIIILSLSDIHDALIKIIECFH